MSAESSLVEQFEALKKRTSDIGTRKTACETKIEMFRQQHERLTKELTALGFDPENAEAQLSDLKVQITQDMQTLDAAVSVAEQVLSGIEAKINQVNV